MHHYLYFQMQVKLELLNLQYDGGHFRITLPLVPQEESVEAWILTTYTSLKQDLQNLQTHIFH